MPVSAHPTLAGPAAFQPDPGTTVTRTEALRNLLPQAMECLKARKANLIGDQLIEDFVALDWLEWAGGGLRLTEIGRNVCSAMARRSG